jgi:hypothetical protein
MLNEIAELEFNAFGRPLTCAIKEAEAQFSNDNSKNGVNEIVYIGTGGNEHQPVDTCEMPLPHRISAEREEITFSALYSDNDNRELSDLAGNTRGMSRQFTSGDAVHSAAKITANIMSHFEQKSVKGKLLDQPVDRKGL